jgi:hypothetical protein
MHAYVASIYVIAASFDPHLGAIPSNTLVSFQRKCLGMRKILWEGSPSQALPMLTRQSRVAGAQPPKNPFIQIVLKLYT